LISNYDYFVIGFYFEVAKQQQMVRAQGMSTRTLNEFRLFAERQVPAAASGRQEPCQCDESERNPNRPRDFTWLACLQRLS
jgi:hypothetical protein